MAGEYQFGIDDAKVAARDGAGVIGTRVDVLGVSSFSLNVEADSVEHRGDNEAKRIRKTGKKVSGSVAQAATHLATLAVIGDGEVTTTGTTPAIVTTYTEPPTALGLPYQIEVQAADIDGATRFTVPNAQTTGGPNFDMGEGAFTNPGWDYEGTGYEDVLFKIEQFETEVPIGTP